MRTTVEISEAQRVALTALAAERGLRGFSPLGRDAIDASLNETVHGRSTGYLPSVAACLRRAPAAPGDRV